MDILINESNMYLYLNEVLGKNYLVPQVTYQFFLLDDDENRVETLKVSNIVAGSGSFHKDLGNGKTRTLSFSLFNEKGKEYGWETEQDFFKWQQKYEFLLGYTVSKDTYWFKEGIFVLQSISVSKNQENLALSLSDKYCLLDGLLDGFLDSKYKILANSATIENMVTDLLSFRGRNGDNYDVKTPLIPSELKKITFPYEFSKDITNKVSDIFSEISTVFNVRFFYDVNGQLNITNNTPFYKHYETNPVMWNFRYNDYYMISDSTTYDYSKFYNKVLVTGNSNAENGVIQGSAEITNPFSPLRVSKRIGTRQCSVTNTKLYSSILAQQEAKGRLTELAQIELSNKISCVFLPHLEPGGNVYLTSQDGHTHLYRISSIDISLSANPTMSISLTQLNVYPIE